MREHVHVGSAWRFRAGHTELCVLGTCLHPFHAAVHKLNMVTMTALWLVPVIPGTAAACVVGAVSQVTVDHHKAISLVYLGEPAQAVPEALHLTSD